MITGFCVNMSVRVSGSSIDVPRHMASLGNPEH